MASNNSFLNQFGNVTREGEAPLINPAQALPVPTNVPFIQPPSVIPENLGDMQKYSPLNQLAQALNVMPAGLAKVSEAIQKANERQQAQEQNRQYALGLNDAATRATKTRDLFSDWSQKGLMPASNNPFYVMGLQSGMASNLAAQYRNELVQARISNPYAKPAELQDQIKQKFVPLLQSIAPELAFKNFVEPSQTADKDDESLYLQKNDEAFGAEILKHSKGAVLGTAQSEMALYFNGNSTLESVQAKVKTAIEEQLKAQSATGIPYKPTADAIVDTIKNYVKTATRPDGTPATLAEKKALLKAVETVQLPDGNQVLSLKGIDDKLARAYDDTVNDSLQVEKLERENQELQKTQNTDSYKQEIYLDAAGQDGRKLQSWEHYLSIAMQDSSKPVDIEDLKKAYDAQNSSVFSSQDRQKSDLFTEMMTDVQSGFTLTQLQTKYRPYVGLLIKAADYNDALKSVVSNTRRAEEANKPIAIPDAQLKAYTDKEIAVPVSDYDKYALGDWAGFGSGQAIRIINQKLQAKWLKEFKRRIVQEGLTEQSTPEEKQAAVDRIWSTLEPGIQQDYKWIQQAAKDPRKAPPFAQVMAGTIPAQRYRPGNPTPARKPVTVPPATSGWWQDPAAFKQANSQFIQRKGPAWDFFVSNLKKTNQAARLNYYYQQALTSPEGEQGQPLLFLVRKLQSRGVKTFLGQQKGASNGQPQRR